MDAILSRVGRSRIALLALLLPVASCCDPTDTGQSQEASMMNAEADPAARVARIAAGFGEVRNDYARVEDDIDDLVRVRFDLAPKLLLAGENLVLTIEARSALLPNRLLEVVEGCHSDSPAVHQFHLDWKRQGHRYAATWEWQPPRTGNYLLRWDCDIGGDIERFRRNFAVVDGTYAVLILNSTSHRKPRPEPDFHELQLPFSYWAEIPLSQRRPSAAAFASVSRNARQFGDDPGLMIFNAGAYLPAEQTVFSDEPEAVQRAVLNCYSELWKMCRFPHPLNSLYTYGMGNGPADVARDAGIDILGALCADQNWGDGPFKINHWGMPARPYFVSRDDFRKPGPGGAGAMVGIQQCARHTVPCRDYNCVYCFEAGIEYALEQYAGVNRSRTVGDIALSREIDFLHCFIECARLTDGPYLVSCGFEFNGVWPQMAEFNRHFMEYLVRRAGDAPLAYTNATAAADFMRRHYARLPETVLYLPDVYAGITHNGKPVNHRDTMEIENHMLRAIFRRADTLPYAQYDYTVPWQYPDWGNEDIPRKPNGYIIPDTDDRFRVTPSIVDTRPFEVEVGVSEVEAGTEVVVEIQAARSRSNLALALWDLPRTYTADPSHFVVRGAKRFIPVRAPYTHNFCGIIITDVEPGSNRISVLITSPPPAPGNLEVPLGEHGVAKVFERDGTAIAYVFCDGSEAASVELRLSPDQTANLYRHGSDEPVTLTGTALVEVEPGQCHKLVGLSRDQLVACAAGK